MSEQSDVECACCGRTPPDSAITAGDRSFCSAGCRDVVTTLGATEPGGAARPDPDTGTAGNRGAPAQTFLRVDGMHSATCEAFLESVATGHDGVHRARASYITESIRVDHDPDLVSAETLADALSTVGYTAYRREAEADGRTATTTGSRHDPRINQERGLGDLLGFRYALGVLFGSFLLLPYVVLLYPVFLSDLFGGAILSQFDRGVAFSGAGGLLILRLYLFLTGVILVFTGLPLFQSAYVSLKMRRPDTTLLVAVTVVAAYLYSAVAAVVGRTDIYFDLTVVVSSVVVAAIFYESLAKQRALDRLTELTLDRVTEATRYEPDGTTTAVPTDELAAGDRILVRNGERIPVDGVLAEGSCTVDESLVTGESLPVLKTPGDTVIGGSIVTSDAAVVSVDRGTTSSIERIVTAVWDLQSATHGIQRRANRIAGTVAPLVAAVAILTAAGTIVAGSSSADALLSFFLVCFVLSPWALGVAMPLSVATSIEEATKQGIVVFDETVFERIRDIDVAVFDKTGTLTTGRMDVVDADAPDGLLRSVGALERHATHPAAAAIEDAFGSDGDPEGGRRADGGTPREDATADGVDSFTSYPTGVEGEVDGTTVMVGHPDLFAERGWTVDDDISARVASERGFGRLPVVVGRDGRAEGYIVLGDEPREGWDETVTELGERDIDVIVLTGDDERAAAYFRSHSHVEHVFADVPPAGKTATVRRLQSRGNAAMIGDGTNDAPALAEADLGISLGGGTSIASDAADIALVDDDLTSVATTVDLARRARRRVRQNTWLALSYNAITVPLAVGGLLNPLLAMGAVIVSGGLVAVNSFREMLPE